MGNLFTTTATAYNLTRVLQECVVYRYREDEGAPCAPCVKEFQSQEGFIPDVFHGVVSSSTTL